MRCPSTGSVLAGSGRPGTSSPGSKLSRRSETRGIKSKRLDLPWVRVEKEYEFDSEEARRPSRPLRRALTAARLQRYVRPRLHARRLPRLHRPGRRARRLARPPEPPRRDVALFLEGADRAADRLQAADGLAVPLRLHLQHRLRLRLRPCADRGAGAADSRGQGDDRQPSRLAPGVVTPDRGRAQGRAARGPELDRLRARERDRLPHLYGDGARPVRRAVLQLPARANTKAPTRRAPHLAEGRVPGLTPDPLPHGRVRKSR